jgi:diguanylate cyclase (GGDEF)-like protein
MAEAGASPLHLLLIADRAADADLLRQYMAGWPAPRPVLDHVDSLNAACNRLATGDIDVVMLVVQDGSRQALAESLRSIAQLRKTSIGITVLALTGVEPDERTANQILQSANDYLVKDQLSPWPLLHSIRVASKCQGLQRQLLKVLNANPDGMIVVDDGGRVLYANHTGATMFGRNVQELQGELFGYPLTDADQAELDFGTARTAEMRVVDVEWAGGPAHLITLRDVTERLRQQQRLVHMAGHDSLTKLMTRSRFCEELDRALARANRRRSQLAALFLDIDRFKPVNDLYGHDQGDELLKEIAQRLAYTCRASEFVSRLGGDEFTVTVEDLKPGDEAHVAERFLSVVRKPFELESARIGLSMSIGIALYPDGGATPTDLISAADKAMYLAKQVGGNTYRYYSKEVNDVLVRRTHLEHGLRTAAQCHELRLCYQPQVGVETGAVVGVEALLRWRHPHYGAITPMEIMSIVERTTLIGDIGAWVLTEACRQLNVWRQTDFARLLTMAVNVSAKQLKAPDFLRSVERVLVKTGIEPHALTLEITESVLIEELEQSIDLLHSIGDMGVRIAIDDFGTGFSSLQYLQRLPISALKIDRSFVRDITTNSGDATIVKAVIKLAHALGLQVIAEGVETQEQLGFLKTYGCDLFQGFLYSHPLMPDALAPMLRGFGRRLRA